MWFLRRGWKSFELHLEASKDSESLLLLMALCHQLNTELPLDTLTANDGLVGTIFETSFITCHRPVKAIPPPPPESEVQVYRDGSFVETSTSYPRVHPRIPAWVPMVTGHCPCTLGRTLHF